MEQDKNDLKRIVPLVLQKQSTAPRTYPQTKLQATDKTCQACQPTPCVEFQRGDIRRKLKFERSETG